MTAYNPAGGKTYTLAASISSTATSITLSSFALPVSGTLITMAVLNTDIAYGTIGPKTSSAEFISFTGITQNANGTATLTGVTRGLDKVSPFTTNATYKLPHSGQTLFILSDAPQVFNEYAAKRSDNTFTGTNLFSGVAPQTNVDPVAGNDLARLSYIQALVLGTLTTIDVIIPGTAGETVANGNLVYLKTADNRWWKCDADDPTTVNNVILGIAQGSGTAGNPVTNGILLQGVDDAQSGLTGGTVMYASNTAGAISATPGTTEVTVGVAKSATELYFSPRFNQQLTEDQQDALVGTSGTPSASNKFVTDADPRIAASASSFGGTGADGALSISSGTTTLDLGGASYFVKNYTSISITGTGQLAFSNPATTGTLIVLKTTGGVTLTSSTVPNINAAGMGAAGGAGGSAGVTGSVGSIAGMALSAVGNGAGGIGGAAGGGGAAGTAPVQLGFYSTVASATIRKAVMLTPGNGGGGGGGATGAGGAGGRGGGALYIECGGAWNFTVASGISVAGATGAGGSGGAGSGGGGGGGSGGMFLALYGSLTANSGTVNVVAGNGGAGNGNGTNGGGGGGGACGFGGTGGNGGAGNNNAGGNGTNGGAGGGGGGTGGGGTGSSSSGVSLIEANIAF